MNKWSRNLLVDLAALLSGASLTLAFAPFEVFPLAALAPAFLLALFLHESAKRAFWIGYLFGVGFFSTGVYWVYISIHLYGDVPPIGAALITAGMIAILACYPALTAYLTQRYFKLINSATIVLAYPAIWVALEVLRSNLFSGFSWLCLGYSQTNSPLKGYAPVLGVYSVSLMLMLTGSLILNAYYKFKKENYRQLYINLFLVLIIWTAGGLMSLIPWTKADGKPVSVSLVQGNIPQSLKWSSEHIQLSFDRYRELSEPLWGKTDVIIWPEAAIPMTLEDAADYIQLMGEKARTSKTDLILGIPTADPNGEVFYNAVITRGAQETIYKERHLVPFGQYLPFQPYSGRFFDFMKIPISNLVPGAPYQPPLATAKLRLQTSICYEVSFPELVNTRNGNINALLTVTNDAWFGDSSASAQHLQMGIMSTIALGRPMLFASNDGITAIITADGKLDAVAPTHQPYVLQGQIQPMMGVTPWMHNGMDPLLFILLVLLAFAKRDEYITKNKAIKTNDNSIKS